MYSFLCPLEQVWYVSELVTVDLKLSVLSSGKYTPGNTSPQLLHFNINIGTYNNISCIIIAPEESLVFKSLDLFLMVTSVTPAATAISL